MLSGWSWVSWLHSQGNIIDVIDTTDVNGIFADSIFVTHTGAMFQ